VPAWLSVPLLRTGQTPSQSIMPLCTFNPSPQAHCPMRVFASVPTWLPAGILNHPWFLTGLPKDALAMNSRFLTAPRACSQTEEDIWRVIRTMRRHLHPSEDMEDSVLIVPSLSRRTTMEV
jgi:hypothetical protein